MLPNGGRALLCRGVTAAAVGRRRHAPVVECKATRGAPPVLLSGDGSSLGEGKVAAAGALSGHSGKSSAVVAMATAASVKAADHPATWSKYDIRRLKRSLVDDQWLDDNPGVAGIAQFGAHAPIQDRGFVHRIRLSESTAVGNRNAKKEPTPRHMPTGRSLGGSPVEKDDVLVAAVIDGHGGGQIAEFVSEELADYIAKEFVKGLGPLSAESAALRSKESAAWWSPSWWLPLSSYRRGMTERGTGGNGSFWQERLPALLKNAFQDLDEEIKRAVWRSAVELGFSRTAKCGACACAALISKHFVVVANAGDCKAVLSRGGVALPLSRQHNANEPEERAALEKAHPGEADVVMCKKMWEAPREPRNILQYPFWYLSLLGNDLKKSACYVKGRLQPTRSFGDFHLKDVFFAFDKEMGKLFVKEPHSFPYISVEPEVSVLPRRHAADEFIVMGSDGIWDFLKDQEAVDIVKDFLKTSPTATPAAAADEIINTILRKAELSREEATAMNPTQRRSVFDDMTCVVVLMDQL